ncbi:hypothetical protein EB118_13485 [bacterium]|nr:hypothetical protein [bacterium]NDD84828.1 hypothetical protein [bacterium]NDG31065.1 hypothetical protein [bacterium]
MHTQRTQKTSLKAFRRTSKTLLEGTLEGTLKTIAEEYWKNGLLAGPWRTLCHCVKLAGRAIPNYVIARELY